MRQPNWTIDEVLLGVQTYFEIGDVRKMTPDNPELISLSQTLRTLPVHEYAGETFRNVPGVEMTLKSIAVLDKESRYSMKTSSGLQRDVYCYYKDDEVRLKRICEAIKACLPLPFEFKKDVESPCRMVGNILYQYHLHIEHDTAVAKIAKRNAEERQLSHCQICGNDLCDIYGEEGVSLLEQHYSESVIHYSRVMKILPGKFIGICPTCHEFAHCHPESKDIRLTTTAKREGNV